MKVSIIKNILNLNGEIMVKANDGVTAEIIECKEGKHTSIIFRRGHTHLTIRPITEEYQNVKKQILQQ